MEQIHLSDLSPELKQYFGDKFLALEKEVELLRIEVDVLREKRRKSAKKEFTDKMRLDELKQNFLRKEPNNSTEPLDNWELVFWAGYILSSTPRHEKVDSMAEMYKRGYRIQEIVNWYKEHFKNSLGEEISEEVLDGKARQRVKDYLEYVLRTYTDIPTKDGKVPMGFWICTSDWAITQYGSRVGSWQQTNRIEDKPVED